MAYLPIHQTDWAWLIQWHRCWAWTFQAAVARNPIYHWVQQPDGTLINTITQEHIRVVPTKGRRRGSWRAVPVDQMLL